MNRAWFAAIFLLLGSSFFLSAGAAQSTLRERALKAPAYDLARSYYKADRAAKNTMQMIISWIEKDSNIVIIQDDETKRKARTDKKENAKRLSAYAEAITERGYKTIAGFYQARASESCGQIQSFWVGLIHEGTARGIEIQQDGYEAQLLIGFEHEGEERTAKNPVIVVETSVMVHDVTNATLFFRGEIKGEKIVIKPDLAAWRKWAVHLREKALRECTITLEPRKGNPGGQGELSLDA